MRVVYSIGSQHAGRDELLVVNHGYSGLNQREQMARLKDARLGAGGIAVFYDGANDVWQTLYYGKPNLTMRQNDRVTANQFGFAYGFELAFVAIPRSVGA